MLTNFQDPLGSYGPRNVAKIREVAKKYDPKGVFQNKAPGGFKISKAGSRYKEASRDDSSDRRRIEL